MNNLKLKIKFYKYKIKNVTKKIIQLKKQIKCNKSSIIQFIKTIENTEFKKILFEKINTIIISNYKIKSNNNLTNIEYYNFIKYKYQTLKYYKNILLENWLLLWCDNDFYEHKIHFILQIS
jgi:hypothetical protein